MDTNIPKLKFFSKRHPGFSYIEHITPDDGKTVLCGEKAEGKALDNAHWWAIHSPRSSQLCPQCREKAILALRPVAQFWYLDPFSGHRKNFPTAEEAIMSARTEHGTCTIWQYGPGDISKIIATVKGLDPLP